MDYHSIGRSYQAIWQIECSVNFLCILSRVTLTLSGMSIIMLIDLLLLLRIAYWSVSSLFSTPMLWSAGNWILERSIDGVTFDPWQYYAITDTECLTRFNIYPRTGPPSYTRDDEVICTSFYSKIHPLENGEVRLKVWRTDKGQGWGWTWLGLNFCCNYWFRLELRESPPGKF